MPRRACNGLLAFALSLAGCSGWSEVRHIAAPTASFERVVRQPASATFALERGQDQPVCYEYSDVIPKSPTCVDGLRAHFDGALDALLSDFLTRASPGARPDYVATFELSRVDRLMAPRGASVHYEAQWGISIVDRRGAVVVRAARTTHGEPTRDVLGGLRELQVAVLRDVRGLLSESILAAPGGAPTAPTG
jgi:hypothetical protein